VSREETINPEICRIKHTVAAGCLLPFRTMPVWVGILWMAGNVHIGDESLKKVYTIIFLSPRRKIAKVFLDMRGVSSWYCLQKSLFEKVLPRIVAREEFQHFTMGGFYALDLASEYVRSMYIMHENAHYFTKALLRSRTGCRAGGQNDSTIVTPLNSDLYIT
jgi:hypothetical protein